jgi:bifunctional non-homologous end joining protein LigD
MSLKEYKRKRDFKKTPEPSGDGAKNAPGRQFVVQKHAARRLHYDFRLELGGTLKSWAVPKGPSLDPAVKSLAVEVEDHPLDYATFEGVIPQGEYGGGTVMVWDRGTWEPEEDPIKGLKQGKLKIRLFGEKLRGSWALVRMGRRSGDDRNNWLLIKHRDEFARPAAKSDILTRKPRSVVTGRTMEQIASDADRVWSSNGKAAAKSRARKTATKPAARSRGQSYNGAISKAGAKKKLSPVTEKDLAKLTDVRRAKQPADFRPQLATLASRVPDGENWLHELKFDGYRALAFFENGKVRLISRNGNDWTARFQAVADALEELPIKNAILDGEVVSLDSNGLSNFQQLQNQMKRGDDESLVDYLFDMPHCEGYDLTRTPLAERKEVLARLVLSANPKNEGTLRYSDHIAGHGEKVLQHACRSAMEGVVCKRADSAYQQTRSSSWLKVKCLKEQEFVIAGYTKPEGSRVGFGALLLGYYNNKSQLVYAGKVGTGFTTQSLRELTAELKKRRIDSSPFDQLPKGIQRRGITWVKPELVAQVEFAEWTSDGRLRQPSFKGLREDKPPEKVTREMAKSPAALESSSSNGAMKSKTKQATTNQAKTKRGTPGRSKPAAASRNGKGEAVVAGVRLTNPDRVLYPDQGITKLQLAEYYERVADWILPYVVKRPLTLVRCPEGYTGECFFQKHFTGSLPDAVRAVMVPVKGKREEYVAVDDIAGVVALVQMGVLEIHPWPAREDKLEQPDQIVMDLDPGEGVEWKAVVEGAKEVRDRLTAVGLTSFLRTSGGKGLHVVLPLARRNTWDELKQFAKAVADTMTRESPDRYLATLSKAKRRGKVFVDYLRNQRGATAIASYSSRRKAGAPVAVPIAWEELSMRTKPDMYNIVNLPKRLAKLSSDPWDGFFSTRQSITRKMMAAFS